MNSKIVIDPTERIKSLQLIKTLENTSTENMQNIVACRSKLETINEEITFNKKVLQYYEKKLNELYTDIANVQWNQTMARTFLKSDAQFVENFKNIFFNKEQIKETTVQDESFKSKIFDLEQEKENLEKYCNSNDRIIEELFNKYQTLKEQCEMYEENKDNFTK